jgi:polyhydroxyalkanoate synthesis regulator phasin
MVDMTMFTGAMSALKSASEITKLMIAAHDAHVVREKAIELQAQIFTAQQNALSAQSEQFALLERLRELEEQIANLQAWDSQKRRYKMEQVTPGAITYALKEEESGGEPPHWICAACYEQGRRFVLQQGDQVPYGFNWDCPGCKAHIRVHRGVQPTW